MLNVVILSVAFYLLLCWVSLCWASLCWMSLCLVSLGWVSWHHFSPPFTPQTSSVAPRNTNWGDRLSTVDLLLKVACFVKKENNSFNVKMSWFKLVSTRRSTVLIRPSPSVRLPWLQHQLSIILLLMHNYKVIRGFILSQMTRWFTTHFQLVPT
jgi:hypothetical protein